MNEPFQQVLGQTLIPALVQIPSLVARWLWLIPVMPAVAAAVTALLPQSRRRTAATLSVASLGLSLLIALAAMGHVLSGWCNQQQIRETVNFTWIQVGATHVDLGWVLDPLSAVMLVMVTLVGLLIFIYSIGYMATDENFTRFFCFLSLFAGAMLGVVIANSLLLLFICWELVGLTSYLLIGFWYQRPAAAAAAKKAFLTTRIGDVFFLLGMVWLFAQTGTLLFYKGGAGALEPAALHLLLNQPGAWGLSAATAIGLLIFAGAAGKSGQLPLHVWLPDAMEGPTPVSALIHAATMVAAGVYLVARVYPLMHAGAVGVGSTTALTVIAWVGASTAVFAALIAVAQNDIKRILAYSTISQLGYMMVGLATGGVAVGMFHLITHAFFKALLFMGAGSVIHGCHEEQDIRSMGGLRSSMPLTFITYAIGTLALCGFPLLFSGFWSKDGILEAAHGWNPASGLLSRGPFYLLLFGALLTAFYMTRQVCFVFFGRSQSIKTAHESPAVMTIPLMVLAFFAVALGAIGTPAWPWFRAFLDGRKADFNLNAFAEPGLLGLMALSSTLVFMGLGLGYWLYGRRAISSEQAANGLAPAAQAPAAQAPAAQAPDAVEQDLPLVWSCLRDRLYVDELYECTVITFYRWWGQVADWIDRRLWGGVVTAVARLVRLVAEGDRLFDQHWVDGSFDKGCEELSVGGGLLARMQTGRVQTYLRLLSLGVAVLTLAMILIWSGR